MEFVVEKAPDLDALRAAIPSDARAIVVRCDEGLAPFWLADVLGVIPPTVETACITSIERPFSWDISSQTIHHAKTAGFAMRLTNLKKLQIDFAERTGFVFWYSLLEQAAFMPSLHELTTNLAHGETWEHHQAIRRLFHQKPFFSLPNLGRGIAPSV